jgi:1-acyl-sn-glycerol-3-phosphate acyltransferase|tara:strand:+ start:97 stop:819 length:723 start_codon:yes stop_codon:yes gene_type:complete
MIRWLISLVFMTHIYFMMVVIGLLWAPYAILSPEGARAGAKAYSRYVFWSARWMIGLRVEVRGEVPSGEVIIAAKHQSFLDIMMIFTALPTAKFIMKKEILWTPVIGLYAKRLGCVPVARGKRGAAISKMVRDVENGKVLPGQLIIYSQGTRMAPGVKAPYKVGTAVLYKQLQQPCVPVATNAGVFWPRTGVLRKPGLAVVEFLPAIPVGQDKDTFMAGLEDVVETHSNALMREAGFDPS